jgi:hypothetical protein
VTALSFLILALAAHRLTRLIGWDTITAPLRVPLLGYDDQGRRTAHSRQHPKVGEFLHCPWCLGFWVCLALYLSWRWWPDGTLVVATVFALSDVVGFAESSLGSA